MRRIVIPFILILTLLPLFSGCSSRPPLSGLVVELVKLERGADGTETATLQVANSTVVAFNIARSTHRLFLDGRLAGTIAINEPLGLPAQRTMRQTARFKPEGGVVAAGPASYRLDSSLTLLLFGDSKETEKLSSTGTVQVP